MKVEQSIGKHGCRNAPAQEGDLNRWVKDVVCGCPLAGNESFFSLQKKPPFTHIPVIVPDSTSA